MPYCECNDRNCQAAKIPEEEFNELSDLRTDFFEQDIIHKECTTELTGRILVETTHARLRLKERG